MEALGHDIWVFDGGSVPFLTLPFSTRMTIVRLSNGDLWVHSPVHLSGSIKEQISSLGCVKYLIAPNHLHHLFLAEWIAAFPDALVYGTDEVIKKCQELTFHASLNEKQHWPWRNDIEQEMFTGSPLMEECVFFHGASGALIVTDLVENFSGKGFNYLQRVVAKGVGILAPNGKMPLDWRLSFMFGKAGARKHLKRMLVWNPQILIMSHGEIVKDNTGEFLVRAFKWLL